MNSTSPLFLALAATLLVGCGRSPEPAAEIVPRDTLLAEGETLYGQACAMCHLDGGGNEINPPLRGAPAVTAARPEEFIDIILRGRRGPIERNGKVYNAIMPAQAFLTDREVAALATYVRSTMGGPVDAVQPESVARVRGQASIKP
jgi:mono/diheme cytochrome c family protein